MNKPKPRRHAYAVSHGMLLLIVEEIQAALFYDHASDEWVHPSDIDPESDHETLDKIISIMKDNDLAPENDR